MFKSTKKSYGSSSSSSHVVNADFPMERSDKIKYFVLNLSNNLITKFDTRETNVRKFCPSKTVVVNHVNNLESVISPCRILCDVFWENLDWTMIQAQLKAELRVVEVGCGTGRYGEKLKSFANIESYLGIDIEPNDHWAVISSDKIHFQVGSYEDVLNLVRGQNLIITQSAIEHFEEDIVFFDLIKKYAESCDFPVMAIHLFPSPACLFTMLLHGIRQYNRRAIKQLVKVSGQTRASTLFALGGFRSNYFHFVELTLRSLVLRRPLATKDVKRYLNKASKVLVRDSNSKLKFSPSFYALCLTWRVDATELKW